MTVKSFIRGALIRKRVVSITLLYFILINARAELPAVILFDQSISNSADHTHLIGLTSSKFLVFYNEKKITTDW